MICVATAGSVTHMGYIGQRQQHFEVLPEHTDGAFLLRLPSRVPTQTAPVPGPSPVPGPEPGPGPVPIPDPMSDPDPSDPEPEPVPHPPN